MNRKPTVYIDANPIIYFIEEESPRATAVRELFKIFEASPGAAVTSELTLAEVLAKVRTPADRRAYLELLVWGGGFDLRPVTRDILIETADYRRISQSPVENSRMPRLPDSIHVVTAIRSRCDVFLSSDAGIKVPVGMTLTKADVAGIGELAKQFA